MQFPENPMLPPGPPQSETNLPIILLYLQSSSKSTTSSKSSGKENAENAENEVRQQNCQLSLDPFQYGC